MISDVTVRSVEDENITSTLSMFIVTSVRLGRINMLILFAVISGVIVRSV